MEELGLREADWTAVQILVGPDMVLFLPLCLQFVNSLVFVE